MAGDVRVVQTATTVVGMQAAGSAASDVSMVAKGMGHAGGLLAGLGEGARVVAEIDADKDPAGALIAAGTRLQAAGAGAYIGGQLGGPLGALGGALVGAAIGEPAGEMMREQAIEDSPCASSLTGCTP